MNVLSFEQRARPPDLRRDVSSPTLLEIVIDGAPLTGWLDERANRNGFNWVPGQSWLGDFPEPPSRCLASPFGCVGGDFERRLADALLMRDESAFPEGKCFVLGCGFCYDPGFDDYVVCSVIQTTGAVRWEGFEWIDVTAHLDLEFFAGLAFEFEWSQYVAAFDLVLNGLGDS